jgi:hypothetical protein
VPEFVTGMGGNVNGMQLAFSAARLVAAAVATGMTQQQLVRIGSAAPASDWECALLSSRLEQVLELARSDGG